MTNMIPQVSVCIANYNGIAVIDDCLCSVLGQEGHIPIEILVHDDASSDGSAAHIRGCYPDVKLIESRENVGFCVANNRMAHEAKGKYLLLLNNDAELCQDALQTLLAEANRIGQPAVLGLPQYDAASGELIDIGNLLDPFLNPVPNRNPDRGDVGMVIGACLWVPRSLWKELGGFPEWFGSIGEDLYLCCRARLSGYQIHAVGYSGFRHHVGHSFGGGKVKSGHLSSTLRRRALSERNKTFVMITSYPTPVLQFMLPLHLVFLITEGLAVSLIKLSWAPWRVIYAPLLPALWNNKKTLTALRHKIQSSRRINLWQWLSVFQMRPYKLQMLFRHGMPELR